MHRRSLLLAVALLAGCGSPDDLRKPHQPPAPVVVAPLSDEAAPTAISGPAEAAPGASAPLAAVVATPEAAPQPPAQLPEGEDVTALVREHQSRNFAAPPSVFRPGHVTPRQLSRDALTRRADGFAVRLPSGAPVTSPAVYDGKVYVSGGFRSKELYAIDALTGALAWGLDLDDDGPSAPACADGVCAFNTESCTLFVVDARTGAQRWSWWLGDPLTSAPTLAQGRVFTSYPVAGAGVAPPSIQGDGNPVLHGAAPGSGVPPAPQAANAPPTANPPAAPASNPAPAASAPNATAAAPSAATPRARPPGATHALAAFDLQTGRVLWQIWLDSDVLSAPVAVGDHLYATSFAGTLYQLEQATGHVVAARRVRATSAPVVTATGEVLYTRRDDAHGEAAAEVVVSANKAGKARWVGPRKAARYLDHAVQASSALGAQAVGNDAANGFSGGAPAAANPKAALDNVGQGNVFSMQAFQGSRVLANRWGHVNSMGDEIVCSDPATGAKRWTHKLAGDLVAAGGYLAAPPAEAGGHLFVGTLAGEVLQLDPKTGAVERRFAVGHPVRSQPVVEGGWIYVGTDDGHLIGLDTGDATLTGWPQWGADAARTGVPRA